MVAVLDTSNEKGQTEKMRRPLSIAFPLLEQRTSEWIR